MPEIQVRWFSTSPASHEVFPTFWILICNLEHISSLPLGSCLFHQIVAFLSWQYKRWLRASNFCSIDGSAYTDNKNRRQKSKRFPCRFRNSGEAKVSSTPWFCEKAQDTQYGCVWSQSMGKAPVCFMADRYKIYGKSGLAHYFYIGHSKGVQMCSLPLLLWVKDFKWPFCFSRYIYMPGDPVFKSRPCHCRQIGSIPVEAEDWCEGQPFPHHSPLLVARRDSLRYGITKPSLSGRQLSHKQRASVLYATL